MSTNLKELQQRILARQANKTEDELLHEEEFILMANYLSEIEKYQKEHDINRKELAAKIKTSASYLTQVFKGDKPLNFFTIAKIQKALKVRFRVITIPLEASVTSTFASFYSIKDMDVQKVNKLPVTGNTMSFDAILRQSSKVNHQQ